MKVIVNGLAIEYEDAGQGPVILFLHGWMDSLRTWDALISALRGYRCVRLDMPGFGQSDAPKGDWHVADYAALIRDFLRKLGIAPHAIVSHSFGGRVAIKALSSKQLSIEKLVLIASAGVAERSSRSKLSGAASLFGKALSKAPFLSRYYEGMRRRMYERMGSDYHAAGDLRGTFVNTIQEDLSDAAGTLDTPTLLIWGDNDTQTPLAEGRKLARLIRGSKLVVFDGATHFVLREKAHEIAEEMTAFI